MHVYGDTDLSSLSDDAHMSRSPCHHCLPPKQMGTHTADLPSRKQPQIWGTFSTSFCKATLTMPILLAHSIYLLGRI